MKQLLTFCLAALTTLSWAQAQTPTPAPASTAKAIVQTIDSPRSITVAENSVVPLYACSLQTMLLTLPAGELIRNAFIADTLNWKLESGRGDQPSRYVSIKVKEPLTKEATLNVISDHDTPYTFKLLLDAGHCDSRVTVDADGQLSTHIASTKPWLSPAEAESLRASVAQAKAGVVAAQERAASEKDSFRANYPTQLQFDYRFDRSAASKLGIDQIFHDDRFTYVKGAPTEPLTFYELKEGKPSLISFDFRNGLYTTGRIVDVGYLAIGGNGNGKHQQKLEFAREAGGEK